MLGYAGSHLIPKFFTGKLHATEEHESYGPAIIDDHTPVPNYAKFNWGRLISFIVIGVGLWIGVMAFLYFKFGWENTLTQMGVFFSKAALVTFGGAYAVLPYVYQGGVDQFQWLTGTQMIDGLGTWRDHTRAVNYGGYLCRVCRWMD